MKKFLLVLCMLTCLFSLTACSAADNSGYVTKFEYNEQSMKANVEALLAQVTAMSDETIAIEIEDSEDAGYTSVLEGWNQTKDEVGNILAYSDWTFTATAERGLEINVLVDCQVRDMDLKIVLTKDGYVDYATFSPQYTKSEIMTRAGLNTVIGICLVFVVLILISFIISLFKYVNIFEQNMKNKKAAKEAAKNPAKDTSVDNTIAQIVQKEEEIEYTDDLELVAVIAAAIAAAEGTNPEGLVVRSIRKVNKNRWQKA